MSIVYLTNVVVKNNPSAVTDPFELDVSFESLESLQEDLEWKLVYVGNAEDKKQDQELECVVLGPIRRGALRFTFAADPPDFTRIERDDLIGVTIILLSGLYRGQEFVRVGWYLQNDVGPGSVDTLTEEQIESMPLNELMPHLRRVILADNPRVTKFNIVWDRPSEDALSRLFLPCESNTNVGQEGSKTEVEPFPPTSILPDSSTVPSMAALPSQSNGPNHSSQVGDHLGVTSMSAQSTAASTMEDTEMGESGFYHCDKDSMCDALSMEGVSAESGKIVNHLNGFNVDSAFSAGETANDTSATMRDDDGGNCAIIA